MFHLVSFWLVLGEPKVYQNLGCFTRMWGFYLEWVLQSWMNVQIMWLKKFGS